MAATLKSQGFRVETLINKDATRTNVLRSLEKLRNRTSHGDVGLFYFSGHGLQLGDNSYISPYDATADHSLLGVDEIQNSLFSAAGTAMIVLDACETGRHSDDSHPSMTSTVRTLFSSQFGSASYESDRLGHGIFTYYLLRGLQGNAADDRGLITWNSLTDFVVRNVSAAKAPEGIPQIPHVVGPTSKDVVIGVSPPTVLVTSNTGGPNAAGWYNSSAVVTFQAADTQLGSDKDSGVSDTGPENLVVTRQGNVQVQTISLNLDNTDPTIVTNRADSGSANHAFLVTGSMVDLAGNAESDVWKFSPYAYDSRDRLVTKGTPEGTLSCIYDALNWLVKVTDASGTTISYSYDSLGNLAGFIFPKDAIHTYSYDALNRLTNRGDTGTVDSRPGPSTYLDGKNVLDSLGIIQFSAYPAYESEFFTWASARAVDELWKETGSEDYFNGRPNNFPLDAQINYLAQLPQKSPGGLAVTSCRPRRNGPRRGPCCSAQSRGVRSLASYSEVERQEMMRLWDHAVRTRDFAAYRLVCSSYPDSVYCAMAGQELNDLPDQFRAKGATQPSPTPAPPKQEDENIVRIKISTLITALISLIVLLVTVGLWILKFLADSREKPKPLITIK